MVGTVRVGNMGRVLVVLCAVALVAGVLTGVTIEEVSTAPAAQAQPTDPNIVQASPSEFAPKLCSTGGPIGIKGHFDQGVVARNSSNGPGSVGHVFDAYIQLPKSDGGANSANPPVVITHSFTNSKPITSADMQISDVGAWLQNGSQPLVQPLPSPPPADGVPWEGSPLLQLPPWTSTPIGATTYAQTGSISVSEAGWYRIKLRLDGWVDQDTAGVGGGGDFTYTLSYSGMPTCSRDALEMACPCNPASGIVTDGTGWKADPVSTGYGNFVETDSDLDIDARGSALRVGRAYNSRLGGSTIPGTTVGYGWTTSFGTQLEINGSDITLRQASGAPAVFSPIAGSGSPPTKYIAAPWVTAVLAPAGSGYTVTYKDGHVETFNAPVANVSTLSFEVNRNGYKTTYDYTAGKVTRITDVDSGRHIDLAWTATTMTATDPAARQVIWTFDGSGDLIDVSDVGQHHHKYGYTNQGGAHLLTNLRAPSQADVGDTSRDIVNHYDTANRVDRQTDNRYTAGTASDPPDTQGTKRARVTTFAYTGGDINTAATSTTIAVHSESATGPLLSQRVDTYANGQRTQSADGIGADTTTRRYAYDSGSGGLAQVDVWDKTSNAWVLESKTTYDYLGNPTTITNGLTPPQQVTYNYGTLGSADYAKYGLPLTVTDPAGVVTRTTYDPTGNITSTCTPNQATPLGCTGATTDQKVTYVYGAKAGSVTWIEDPLHQVPCTDATCTSTNASHLVYDANGYLQEQDSVIVNQPAGSPAVNRTTFVYDNVGRLTSVTAPGGFAPSANAANFTTTITPDAYGATVQTSIPNPLGGAPIVTARQFDANHNVAWTQPADGNCTKRFPPVPLQLFCPVRES